MFRPLSICIGLRYTHAKRKNHYVSFMSLTAMMGIALGVTVLITVLSVMNGFDEEIHNRVFTITSQVTVTKGGEPFTNWKTVLNSFKQDYPAITGGAPFVEGQGMINSRGHVKPVMIYGILPEYEKSVSSLSKTMIKGNISDLTNTRYSTVMGIELAAQLGISVGEKFVIIIPEATVSPMGILPRFRQFTLVGIFDAGTGFGFNNRMLFMGLKSSQKLFRMNDAISGLHLNTDNLYKAPSLTLNINEHSKDYYASDWTDTFGAFFKAIKLEKNMMFIILLLIICVAGFNLVSSLVMLVNDKRADIAILRTFGALPKMILASFVFQGALIGLIGTILGLTGGLLLTWNVTAVVNAIQSLFGIKLLNANIYFVDHLPAKIIWDDIYQICLAAMILALLATIYPAFKASRTLPVEALRYE